MTHPDRPQPYVSALAPASDADKERVVQALSLHFAADHLSLDELEERLARAYQSQSLAQLEGLLNGLPAVSNEPVVPGSAPMYAPSQVVPARGVVIAVLGGNSRKGTWLVPRHLKVFALLGGAALDLREARFAPGVTEIDVTAVMGGVEVTVPPGVRVESLGAAFLGGFESSGVVGLSFDPSQPVLRITGLAILGGVEIKTRGPSRKMLARFEAERRLSDGA